MRSRETVSFTSKQKRFWLANTNHVTFTPQKRVSEGLIISRIAYNIVYNSPMELLLAVAYRNWWVFAYGRIPPGMGAGNHIWVWACARSIDHMCYLLLIDDFTWWVMVDISMRGDDNLLIKQLWIAPLMSLCPEHFSFDPNSMKRMNSYGALFGNALAEMAILGYA